ncbi:hypothetical protein EJ06DRAFT_527681 [Trichodelitschia bisporula]|uniref:Uncharacterized protein n=1 Tax=Trichodelitschia bisporula TaxID=703511 RepID=A0A6G1I3Q2_9PEZI|nr:hypothetical protein EJ06DRAFT_527681 [Trichodelitschia bisporula]
MDKAVQYILNGYEETYGDIPSQVQYNDTLQRFNVAHRMLRLIWEPDDPDQHDLYTLLHRDVDKRWGKKTTSDKCLWTCRRIVESTPTDAGDMRIPHPSDIMGALVVTVPCVSGCEVTDLNQQMDHMSLHSARLPSQSVAGIFVEEENDGLYAGEIGAVCHLMSYQLRWEANIRDGADEQDLEVFDNVLIHGDTTIWRALSLRYSRF